MDAEWVDAWCAWLAASTASSTVRLRRYQVMRLAAEHRLADVTEDDLVEFLVAMGGAPSTRKSMRSALRSFYGWAHRTGRLPSDPTVGLRPVRVPAGVPRPIPEFVFWTAMQTGTPMQQRMLALGYWAGLRRAEIARVHSDDITGEWMRVLGKGGKTRRVPISQQLAPHLAGLSGWAFPSPVRDGEPVTADYVDAHIKPLIDPYTCHQLRHAAATRWYAKSHDLRAVQLLLGHASVATTQIYVATDDAALLAAVA